MAVGMVGLIASAIHYGAPGVAIVLILVVVTVGVIDAIVASYARPRKPKSAAMPAGLKPLVAVRMLAASAGGGVWLGAGEDGQWRFARPERAVLLLGPPRSGKTSSVIIPSVLAHSGPAIVTSTKPDVARATAPSQGGRGAGVDVRSDRREPPSGRARAVAMVTRHQRPHLGRGRSDGQGDDRKRRGRDN